MSVALTYASTVTSVETPSTNVPALATGATLTQNGFNTTKSLTGTTTPTVTNDAYFSQAMTAGAATVDLTALTGTNGLSISMSGSKIRVLKAKAPSGNSAGVTLSKGASNGYTGFGSAFSVDIPPGGEVTIYDGGNGGAVGGTNKTLDMAGTGTDSLNFAVVCGG